jgi:Tol biopolymer transport system component
MSFHVQMYVVKAPRKGQPIEAPTSMNLDEGNNLPFTWTPDGESVIFVSDRGGVPHLYKQTVHQLSPDLLVGGDEPVVITRISPDRSEILYELAPANGNQGGPTRILAMPVNGGSPREVLRANSINDFQCARAPANVCFMAQSNGETTQLSTFDPKTGVVKPALAIQQGADLPDSFSPDGTTLAVAPDFSGRIPAEIQLYNLRDASPREDLEGRRSDSERGPARKCNAALPRHRKPGWRDGSFAGWQPTRVLEAGHELGRMAVA